MHTFIRANSHSHTQSVQSTTCLLICFWLVTTWAMPNGRYGSHSFADKASFIGRKLRCGKTIPVTWTWAGPLLQGLMLSCEHGGVPYVFGWIEGCWIAQWEGGHLQSMPYSCLRSIDSRLFPLDSAEFEAKVLLTFDARRYQFTSAQFKNRHVFLRR